jgi:serpin B
MIVSLYFIGLLIFCGGKYANGQLNELVRANTDLGIKILKAGAKTDNTFLSPIGVSFMMGMLNAGASGNTKAQILKAIFNNQPDQAINGYMKAIQDKLSQKSASDFYNASFANRIYVQTTYPISKSYTTTLLQYYYSDVKLTNFDRSPETSRRDINSWVDAQTNHEIQNMFPPGSLDRSVLVLLNIVYFKESWRSTFNKSLTTKKDFFTNENVKSSVDMMAKNEEDFYYFLDDDVKVLGLPFGLDKDKEKVMYVILPANRFGLDAVVSTLTTDRLQEMITGGSVRHINKIELPKLILDTEVKTNDLLQNLGVTDMFNLNKADFSGVDGWRDVFITDVVQQLVFKMDETGVEAVRARGVNAGRRALPVEFIVDQPFAFVIVDSATSTALFMGRIVKIQ